MRALHSTTTPLRHDRPKIGLMGLAVLVSLVGLAAPVSQAAPTTATSDSNPALQGIPSGWWQTVQRDLAAREYHLSAPRPGVAEADNATDDPMAVLWQAPNRAQNLRSRFDAQGMTLSPRVPNGEDWSWGLELISIGSPCEQQPVAKAELTAREARLEYRRQGLIEWYLNSPAGVEQGFTLDQPPDEASDTLELRLALRGNLRGEATSDGQRIDFYNRHGVRVLDFHKLNAWDADQKPLSALMELDGDRLSIRVAVAEARYPITIDPLASSPSWQVTGAGNTYLGRIARSAGDVNGDGFADVLVTEDNNLLLYLGSANGPSTSPSQQLGTPAGITDWARHIAAAGDVNGDGRDDVMVTATKLVSPPEYHAMILFGNPNGLDTTAGWDIFYPDLTGTPSEVWVAGVGDVNNDGFADVMTNFASNADLATPVTSTPNLYLGSASGPSTSSDWNVSNPQAGSLFGYIGGIAGAGDINGDGFDDLVIGAKEYTNTQTNEGAVFVYLGSGTGLALSPHRSFFGGQAGADFGAMVTGGDFNGDGYSDIAIGAPLYETGQVDEGAVFVYNGTVDGLVTSPSWSSESNQANALYGKALASAGDVNDDGADELVVGALSYDSNGFLDNGLVYMFYGSQTGLDTGRAWSRAGDADGQFYGHNLASAGDVNGDGFDEVLIGYPDYQDLLGTPRGRVDLFTGSTSGLSIAADWQGLGDQGSALYGRSVAGAGDINGDGFDDLLVGAPSFDASAGGPGDEGAAFVYLGASNGPSTTPFWSWNGPKAGSHFGQVVAGGGDLNWDGYDDMVIGAPALSDNETNEGAIYLFYGSFSGLSFSPDWSYQSNTANARLGTSVAINGDLDNDGLDDLVVGAPGDASGNGSVSVFFGWFNFSSIPTAPDWTYAGSSDDFGAAVAIAGDVNGDGFDDLLVGGPLFVSGTTQGRAVVFHGAIAGPSLASDWSVLGGQDQSYFGSALAGAGDVNGDGYDDVIVGAYNARNGEAGEGRAYVYLGSATGLETSAAWTGESDQINAAFGQSVAAAGDVNGDGYDDIIVGSPFYGHRLVDEGAAFLYFGSPTGIIGEAAWSGISNQAGASFGYSVAGVGDVNGDGLGDVLIGAPYYDNPSAPSAADQGAAFLYLGVTHPRDFGDSQLLEANQAGAAFGSSVNSAGDVNGDGYSDVIVGAPRFDSGNVDEGAAFVYLGNGSGLRTVPHWHAEGGQAGALFGSSVASAMDIDASQTDDVIVGAPGASPSTPSKSEGQVHVYLSGPSGLDDPEASHRSMYGSAIGGQFGFAVATAGDWDGNESPDILVGAPFFADTGTDEGVAFVYQIVEGFIELARIQLSGDQTLAGAQLGHSVAGNLYLNGDFFADVVIGAPNYSDNETGEGAFVVVYGSNKGGTYFPDLVVPGPQADAAFGSSVASAGDVNGDNFGDLIIGAPGYSNGETAEGAAYIYRGTGLAAETSPSAILQSNEAFAAFGGAVAGVGDVNADGFDDVLIGSAQYGSSDQGAAFLYSGSAVGLGKTPVWTAQSDQGGSGFGGSLAGAGDVNGDGYMDWVVGTPGYTNGQAAEGIAQVFYGGNIRSHTVSPSANAGGVINPNTSQTIVHGTATVFNLTPGSGFAISDVTGCAGTLNGGVYTTAPIVADCTVVATFAALPSYTVTPSFGSGGSVSPNTPQPVTQGNTIAFTLTPNTNFAIGPVSGCGGTLSGNLFTTAPITADCTVTGSFSATAYVVTPQAGAGGSIDPATPQTIGAGGTTSFTITPDAGLTIASAQGCGGSLSGNLYTTGPINAACTVNVSFTYAQYSVSQVVGSGGGVSPTGSTTAAAGAQLDYTLTPDPGYAIASATGCGGSLAGSVYTTGPINSSCTVYFSFSPNGYTVTPNAGSGGSITPNTAQLVSHGQTAQFTVTPNSGKTVTSASGCGGSLNGDLYTTAPITANCEVTITFGSQSSGFLVTSTTSGSGSISPAGEQLVSSGGTIAFTLTPDPDNFIASASGCQGSLSGNTYTTGAITAPCTVRATFQSSLVSIVATANPAKGGTVICDPNPAQLGGSSQCTASANLGYSFISFGGDCSGSSCSFSNITSPKQVIAQFGQQSNTSFSCATSAIQLTSAPLGDRVLESEVGISTSGTVNIASGASLGLVSGGGINLAPGFSAANGSHFQALAIPVQCSN